MQKRTPAEVLRAGPGRGHRDRRRPVLDLPGLMQHFSVPAHELTEDVFEEGFGFDGSSIRGFQEIQESDMLLMPDPDTAVIDPFRAAQDARTSTASSATRSPASPTPATPATSPRRPRPTWARPASPTPCYFGPEAEFFIFDDVRFDQDAPRGLLPGRLGRGHLELGQRRGPEPRLQDPATRRGTSRSRPMDHFQDLRSEMILDHGAASASRSRCSTTRWPPPARPRSTCASTRCSSWPTSSCSTSTW